MWTGRVSNTAFHILHETAVRTGSLLGYFIPVCVHETFYDVLNNKKTDRASRRQYEEGTNVGKGRKQERDKEIMKTSRKQTKSWGL